MSLNEFKMTLKYEHYEHLERIPLVYGLGIVSSSVILFQTLNEILKRVYAPSPPSTGAGRKGGDELWKWRNLLISWIHALIVGTWDLTCFFRYPELTSDLIAFHNIYTYALIAFSTGYFIYDFIDIIVSKRVKQTWEVLPHHMAVAGMFFYNVVQCRCVAYNVVALLAEVNTIFLHSRKLLQMSGFSFSHWLYRLNSFMNIFTFVSCRFLCLSWIVYGMFIWYDRVTPIYLYVLGSAMFVMWGTNIILFWRLICSDILRPLAGARSRATTNGPLGSDEVPPAAANSEIHRINGNNSNNNKAYNGVVKKLD